MKRHAFIAIVALLAVIPMFAQSPKGWMTRGDHSSNASDPDAPGANKFVTMGTGFDVNNAMAAVYWNPANTMTGNYTVKGTFKLIKMGGYNEYYGLMFGGSDLGGPGQDYLYFMVSDDGTYLIKRRSGDSTPNVLPKTANDAVKKPDSTGMCTNALEVRVTADKIVFLVNGTVVNTMPKTGQAAKTDGIYGIRVNHRLEVHVEGFAASKQ